MLTGSVFDCLVTTPELYKYFYTEWTSSAQMPDNKVKEIVDAFHEKYPEDRSFKDNMDYLIELLDTYSYQTNWKLNTRLDSVITKKNGELYLEHLVEKGDKTLVPLSLRNKLEVVANRLRYKHQDLISIAKSQEPVYFEVDGVSCKMLPDIVVEHDDYIELVDLKYTQASLESFMSIIKMLRYDIQLSFYKYGLELTTGKKVIPSLLVYSAVDDESQIFNISDLDLQIAEHGALKDNGVIRINENIIPNTIVIKGWRNYFNKDLNSINQDSIWN